MRSTLNNTLNNTKSNTTLNLGHRAQVAPTHHANDGDDGIPIYVKVPEWAPNYRMQPCKGGRAEMYAHFLELAKR